MVATQLREVVADPGKMDQRGYPLGGPGTYLRLFAVHHPDAYVAFVVALLTTGTGTLAQTVTVPKRVAAKDLWSGKIMPRSLKPTTMGTRLPCTGIGTPRLEA